jgi:phage-related protein
MSALWGGLMAVGVGNATQTAFQLTDMGGFAISTPSGASVLINSVATSAYTDNGSGLLTFATAPASGAVIQLLPGSSYTDRLWIPESASRSMTPHLFTAAFGDGYQQNTPNGINFQLETWQLNFQFGVRSDRDAWTAYLEALGGYQAFSWRSPPGPNPIRVLCKKWSDVTKPSGAIIGQATFNQVFGL